MKLTDTDFRTSTRDAGRNEALQSSPSTEERKQWLLLGVFILAASGAMALSFLQHHHALQIGVFSVLILAAVLGLRLHQQRQRKFQELLARQVEEREQAAQKIAHLSQLYAALSQCSQAIIHCRTPEELFSAVCRVAVESGGMTMAWIGAVDPARSLVRPVACYGDGKQYLEDIKILLDPEHPSGIGPTGTSVREDRPVWCQDFLSDPTTAAWHVRGAVMGWASSASLPLHRDGSIVGTFALYSKQIHAFDEDIRKLLVEMAMQISFALDDYARKAAQQAAEEKLHKLGQAVEQSPESIVITDLDGNIEYSNQAFSKISGYSPEETLGQNPRILQSGQTPRATYEDMWRTLVAGKNWEGEFWNRRKSGEVYIESAHISPITQPDGRITHYLAIKKDITLQKRNEDAIRESKLLLQKVIDSTPDWVYVKDRWHRLMLVNATFAAAFRQTPESMIGRPDTDFLPREIDRITPEPARCGLHDNDAAILDGHSVEHSNEKITFADGSTRVFDTFKGLIRDAGQNIYGILCYRRDITERHNKELEQQALERQLLQAQKMELIGHLTGGIAHDFNNILASMLGFTEIIQMSQNFSGNPKVSRYLEEILQAGVRGKELVAQLLTFSHRRETASEAIAIAPIIREVVKLLRSTLPTTIAMSTALAENLPEVLISPVQLHQVLMNLAINARDAIADKGSISIQAQVTALEDFRTCSSCQKNFLGNYVTIAIRDSGAGIATEHLPKIFDPFFTTKAQGQGSGLGLSVLHGIVHSANGHIEVNSVPGRGAEFRIFLPAQHARSRRLIHEPRPDRARTPIDGRVLVVDDEVSIVGFMTALLENLGCQVTGLTSPSEALRLFNEDQQRFDLVITDQSMPELTGAELAGAMLAQRPDLPILLATGYSNSIDEDTANRIGIRRLLIKPVAAKLIADLVTECLTETA